MPQIPVPRPCRALSTPIRHAGDWLNVVPCPALCLHLLDWEFRSCLKYWLGVQMLEVGSTCQVLEAMSDPVSDHHIACKGNGDLIPQHDSLHDIILQLRYF